MVGVMQKGLAPHKRNTRVDWAHREGTISGNHYGQELSVLWDGKKYMDHWPEKALEKIDANSH
jgi:hypothetical protein